MRILHVARQNPISFFSFKDNLWDGLLFKYNYFNVRTCNQYINRLIINKYNSQKNHNMCHIKANIFRFAKDFMQQFFF